MIVELSKYFHESKFTFIEYKFVSFYNRDFVFKILFLPTSVQVIPIQYQLMSEIHAKPTTHYTLTEIVRNKATRIIIQV